MRNINPLLNALKMSPAFHKIPRVRVYTTAYQGGERFRVKLHCVGYERPSTKSIISHLWQLGWRDINAQFVKSRCNVFYSLTIKASR